MVGFITFVMRLSIVPPGVNLTELDVYVAHGLDVDTSQVVNLKVATILLSNDFCSYLSPC